MAARWSVLIAALSLLLGCGSIQKDLPPMHRVPALVNAGSKNVTAVVLLIDELCVKRAWSTASMVSALAATGWQWNEIQRSDLRDPLSLDIWSSGTVQLIRGNAAGGKVSICTIAIEGDTAPESGKISRGLAKLAMQANQNAQEWWWQSSASTKSHMELTPYAFDQRAGVTVTVENYKLPWWQTMVGL